MKCIQYFPKYVKGGVQFDRVTDDVADQEVAAHRATYCPKFLWKKYTRDCMDQVFE